MKIEIKDRKTKANFEIRVTNKETRKSKCKNIYAPKETEESLIKKIKKALGGL